MTKRKLTRRLPREKFTRRRVLIPAAEVKSVRAALGLTQVEFAAVLKVTSRTIMRAEQRGLELPWREDSRRPEVYIAWWQCQEKASKGKK